MKFIPESLRNFYFYSLDNGRLIGSENPSLYPNARDIVATIINLFHIRTLVCLVSDFADYDTPYVTQCHHPLPNDRPPTLTEVSELIGRLNLHQENREPIWCHCHRGTDRTGCVLGGILTQRGVAAEDAIQRVVSQFPPDRRSPRFLALWEPYANIIRSLSIEKQACQQDKSSVRGKPRR